MAENVKIIDGKKFMWDGINYESETAAEEKFNQYSNDGFEAKIVQENEKFYVYTRRVAAEINVKNEPS
jgi:hypothetical protein